MFGYIKPHKPEMKMKEFDVYRSVYCSVCRGLGRNYGPVSKAALSYDVTFLVLMKIALSPGENICFKKSFCRANPFKKCSFCENQDENFDFSAAVSIILFYYKLKDTISDSSFLIKIAAYMIYPYAALKRKKALKKYPLIDSVAARLMKEQAIAENDSSCTLDLAAEPTAKAISSFAVMLTSDTRKHSDLEVFGYHLGRWIYLVDAQNDLENDLKKGNFNPIINRFSLSKNDILNNEKIFEAKNYINGIVNMSMAQIIDAYNNLDITTFSPVIENILYLGMPQSQKNAMEKEGAGK